MSKRKHVLLTEEILTIPRSDFPSMNASSANRPSSPLLLLQLPTQMTVDELSSNDTNIFIQDDGSCRLISEKDRGYTFDLVKVETSNSYILVPEQTSNARLLRENNTFFLECCPHKMDIEKRVREILKEHVYPEDKTGITVSEMSHFLCCSKKEIQSAIQQIQAFHLPNLQDSYGVLSEEMERNAWFLIVSVLAEWEGGIDYAVKGVDADEMTRQVMMRADEDDGLDEAIVQHCIRKCSSKGCVGDRMVLSVEYISRHIAHYLLSKRSSPVPTNEFLREWQIRIPGVGVEYEVNAETLKDIALIVKKDDLNPMDVVDGSEYYYKYFPRESLPTDIHKRFKVLFHERERWLMDDIVPYLKDLVGKSSDFKTVQEMLVACARIAPHGDDGSTWYIAK